MRRVISIGDATWRKRKIRAAYRETFQSEAGRIVLDDLYKRCRINDPMRQVDSTYLATLDGARGIFFYIFRKVFGNEKQIQELEEIERRGNE